MSFAATRWALDHPHCKGTSKLVLMAIADRANPEGTCFPSVASLAKRIGMSRRAVGIIIADLLVVGVIDREARDGPTDTLRLVGFAEGVWPTVVAPSPRNCCAPQPRAVAARPPAQSLRTTRAVSAHEPITEQIIEPEKERTPLPPKLELAHPSSEPAHAQAVATVPPKSAAGVMLFGDPDVGKVPALVNGKAAAFAEFWSLYPPRLSAGRLIKPDKAQAERAFATATKRVPAQAIVDAVRDYPFQLDKPQFIPGPAVWLNKGNYLTEVDAGTGSTGDDMEAARRDWGIGGIAELEELHRQKEIEDGH